MTGHGQGNTDNCAEFCRKDHTVFVDSTGYDREIWRDDCGETKVQPQQLAGSLRIQRQQGHELLRDLVEAFPEDVTAVSLGKPTLEDVFIRRTGHRFWDGDSE